MLVLAGYAIAGLFPSGGLVLEALALAGGFFSVSAFYSARALMRGR